MARWAKLSERIGQDGRLAELAEQNLLAALLFTWSLPGADIYGILPGDAREYKARVAPAVRVTEEQVAEAIDAQVAAGLVSRYEADAKVLLYIRRYHRYQEVRWRRVGPPEHTLPSDWHIPDTLRALLEQQSDTIPAPEDFGLCATPTGFSVQLPDFPGDSRLDVDVDKSRLDTERLLSQTPPAPATPAPRESSNPEILAALRAELSDGDKALIDEYIQLYADQKTKTKAATPRRRCIIHEELFEVRAEFEEDAWRHGLREAVGHGAPNPNYVRRVAEKWEPGGKQAQRGDRRYNPPDNSDDQEAPW